MKFWITLIFTSLAIGIANDDFTSLDCAQSRLQTFGVHCDDVATTWQGHRRLTFHLKRTLQVGDEIIIKGNGTSKWPGAIRLEDTRQFCDGRQRAVNPLVIILRSKRKELKIGKKAGDTRCTDGKFAIKRRVPEIRDGSQYTIKILATQNGFSIKIGTGNSFRLIHERTSNSLLSANVVRAMSGEYFSIKAKRNIQLPLSSNCGVRQGARRTLTRIAGGRTSIAGNYPWQAAIRKKFTPTWNPIVHICGGTLIESCWILTAAHCGKRLSGHEEDYYIRVGDYDNSDHTSPRHDEDEQDLEIDKVYIHEQYNQSTQNPVHDVSLIKLKDIAGTGSCAIFNSRFVTPACLPVVGTDDFATNRTCEISGWGASAYRQNVGDYPKILKQGDVRLRDFDECKSKFGNGTDGRPRVRDGMICAGGEADTCQGDSGGPLACQRNEAMPNSPFVIWGITSWGDKCAMKEKPGVYTKVLDYMPWIMRTIANNIDI